MNSDASAGNSSWGPSSNLGLDVSAFLGATQSNEGSQAKGPDVDSGSARTSLGRIKTRTEELAIQGGIPAFEKAQHVGCPVVLNPESLMSRIQAVVERQWFTNHGQEVQEFESRIEELLGVRHCIATSNGTSALTLTAQALELRGEVILPAFTFIATAHAFSAIGLKPVFAEVDPSTACISVDSVRALINEETAAIVGVHLWGRTCNVAALQQLSVESGIPLLFDASHAFGVTRGGEYVGNFGVAETFSFHATKYISAGEGGAVTTNSDDLAKKLRAARNFGFTGVDCVETLGTNAKLNELCAALGNTSLETLDERVEINRRNFSAYRNAFAGLRGIELQDLDPAERNNFQYVVLRVDGRQFGCDRDTLLQALEAENVRARRYFYPGCHRALPYAEEFLKCGRSLMETDQLATEVLSLPTGPAISVKDIEAIANVIRLVAEFKKPAPAIFTRTDTQQDSPAPNAKAQSMRRGSLF